MNEEGKGVAISTKADLEIQSLFGIAVVAHPGQFLVVFSIPKDLGGIFSDFIEITSKMDPKWQICNV